MARTEVAVRTEHQEQSLVARWASLNDRRFPELRLLFAVPNGGDRHRAVAALLKAEGVKKGVPDLHLPVPRCGYASLFIEMKRRAPRQTKTKGLQFDLTRPTAEQLEWHARLRAEGNAVVVCWTAEEAQAVLESYVDGSFVMQEAS